MAVDTLANMVVEEWWDTLGGVAFPIAPAVIDEVIRSKRLIEPRRALAGLNSADQGRRPRVLIDQFTGCLTLSLLDMTGGQLEYGHGYTYHIFPDPPAVYVNGALVAPLTTPDQPPPPADPLPDYATYTWHPFSMSLSFTVARPEVAPTVQVKGHLVDLADVQVRIGEMLLTKFSTLTSVKGGEFDELVKKVQRRVNHYSRQVVQRFGR